MKAPKVMIPTGSWDEAVSGLLERNLCGVMPLDEVVNVNGSAVLRGLFGVPKSEANLAGPASFV